MKTGAPKQLAPLWLSPLLPFQEHQHLDIDQLTGVRSSIARHDGFRQHQFAARGYHRANVLQDAADVLVIPVVQYVLHEVSIGASRHALEEVAGHRGASAAQAILRDSPLCRLHYLRQLGDHALQLRTGFQNGANHAAQTAAYVGDGVKLREVVCLEKSGNTRSAEASHAFVKQCGFVFVLASVNPPEVLLTKDPLEGDLSGLDRFGELTVDLR